jgi:hypothetical protein
MYNVILRRVCETILAVEKQCLLHVLSVCFCVCVCVYVSSRERECVALVINQAKRMRHVTLSSVMACLALP